MLILFKTIYIQSFSYVCTSTGAYNIYAQAYNKLCSIFLIPEFIIYMMFLKEWLIKYTASYI